MRFVGGRHVFAFSTHGCLPEFFAPSIMPRLKRRGLVVIGIRDWYAKSYLPMTPTRIQPMAILMRPTCRKPKHLAVQWQAQPTDRSWRERPHSSDTSVTTTNAGVASTP